MIRQYRTSLQDFKDAQRAFYSSRKYGLLRMTFWIWVLPALGLASAALLVYDTTMRNFSFQPIVGGVLAALAWIGLFTLIMRPINIRRAYRQMKNGRPEPEPVELEIAGDEIISRVPSLSEGRFRRAAIIDTAEDAKVMLLFVAKKRFLILPKREFSDGDLQAVRNWLQGETSA